MAFPRTGLFLSIPVAAVIGYSAADGLDAILPYTPICARLASLFKWSLCCTGGESEGIETRPMGGGVSETVGMASGTARTGTKDH